MAEHLVLVGMMGAGKSTVGRLAARSLGVEFVDVDDEIERSHDMSIAELFSRRGEAGFRAVEEEELERCVVRAPRSVVSVGGGAVLSARNRERLARSDVTVVWLRAGVDTLSARVGDGRGRPLLAGDTADTAQRLAELSEVRDPLYAEVADAVVDVDDEPAEVVAERVAELWR